MIFFIAAGSCSVISFTWEPLPPALLSVLPGACMAAKQLRDVAALTGGIGGPYFSIASQLDLLDVCHLDTTCRMLRSMHSSSVWMAVGKQTFLGVELAWWNRGLGSQPFIDTNFNCKLNWNWKLRCEHFHAQLQTFSRPVLGRQITTVRNQDQVSYCRCTLQTEVLAHAGSSVYIELKVMQNADNLSLAVVDHKKGFTSVTFSPELGGVIIERQREDAVPGGNHAQFLPAAPFGHKFTGTMGVYLKDGRLAFFRQWSTECLNALRLATAVGTVVVPIDEGWRLAAIAALEVDFPRDAIIRAADEEFEKVRARAEATECVTSAGGMTGEPCWETTGFCTTLWWARTAKLSICVAFRDAGEYQVQILKVGRQPPIIPDESRRASGLLRNFF